jgi:CRP/FNR family transcriptional regulator, cyclic AMP receptor protein
VRRSQPSTATLDVLLDQSPWFQALPPAVRAEVRAGLVEAWVPMGESLGRRGDLPGHWYGVLDGLFKWSVSSADGRSVSLGGQLSGSWFGEGTLIRQRPRNADVVALRDSRVALMPLDMFQSLRDTQPAFNECLLRQINERLHWFMGKHADHSLLDTDAQVARALCGLLHPLHNPSESPQLRLSQEELASMASLSRPRCNQALSRFRARGWIQTGYGGITLLDVEALQNLGEPGALDTRPARSPRRAPSPRTARR